jgi:hypothetical protein
MSTVSNAPVGGWDRRFDPLRRSDEFADVFATGFIRPQVEAVALWAKRGVVDFGWLRELFADRAEALVSSVRSLDREGLRSAYSLLFLEEPLVTGALREFLGTVGAAELPLFVADAIGDVAGAVTCVEDLAQAWMWFLGGNGDTDDD